MKVFREFPTVDAATLYRHAQGCGGWLYAATDGRAFLFPPHMTLTQAFNHPLTRGLDGSFVA